MDKIDDAQEGEKMFRQSRPNKSIQFNSIEFDSGSLSGVWPKYVSVGVCLVVRFVACTHSPNQEFDIVNDIVMLIRIISNVVTHKIESSSLMQRCLDDTLDKIDFCYSQWDLSFIYFV